MKLPPRPARVYIGRQHGKYVVDRIHLRNSARNGWVKLHHVGGAGYASIRELKAVEYRSLVASGFFPVVFR